MAAHGGLDWNEDIRPVLLATYAAVAKGDPYGVEQAAVNADLEREPDDARTDRALFELGKAGYIEATIGPTSGMFGPNLCRLTETGLQYTAGWPTATGPDAADRLIWALEQSINEAPSDAERSKREKALTGVMGIGRDVLTDVLSKLATGALSQWQASNCWTRSAQGASARRLTWRRSRAYRRRTPSGNCAPRSETGSWTRRTTRVAAFLPTSSGGSGP
ncbi:MAG: hypothetical protein ACRDPC_09760 [Solirubrobacteraceae bacterium]